MSKDSTATDITAARTATEAEMESFNLGDHLTNLMWDEPFFSAMLRDITKIETDAVPTAGVLQKDGDLKMYWNRAFLASLTPKQVKGLLKHECFHLAQPTNA